MVITKGIGAHLTNNEKRRIWETCVMSVPLTKYVQGVRTSDCSSSRTIMRTGSLQLLDPPNLDAAFIMIASQSFRDTLKRSGILVVLIVFPVPQIRSTLISEKANARLASEPVHGQLGSRSPHQQGYQGCAFHYARAAPVEQ